MKTAIGVVLLRPFIVFCALMLAMPLYPAFALDPAPGDSCTGYPTNAFIWSGGPENTGSEYGMWCNGSTWQANVKFVSSGKTALGSDFTIPASYGGLTIYGSCNGSGCGEEIHNTSSGSAAQGTLRLFSNYTVSGAYIGAIFAFTSSGWTGDATFTGIPASTAYIGAPYSLYVTIGAGAPAVINFFTNGGASTNKRMIINNSSTNIVGLGYSATASIEATLDVNGDSRLAKYSSQPATCSSTIDGAIALTHVYSLCVCEGGAAAWYSAFDGTSACSW